jgi:rhodanese-related sulfurtransferase
MAAIRTIFQAVLGLVMVTFLTACSPRQTATPTGIAYADSYLVDVRTPEEFQTGSATGAVNIPLHTLSTRLDALKGKKQIVVFCRSGSRSAQAYQILQEAGFTNVVNGGTWSDVQAQLPPH